MQFPNFTTANTTPAYQLRFHFDWYTRGRQPLFRSTAIATLLQYGFDIVVASNGYHLLEFEVSPSVLKALLSLRTKHSPSHVTRIVKGNLATRQRNEANMRRVWSRGSCFPRVSSGIYRQFPEALGQIANC